MVRVLLVLSIALAIFACAAQQQASSNGVAQPTASPASGSSVLSTNGCTVDLKKVCQAFIDQPEFPVNGQIVTWQALTENVYSSPEIDLPAGVMGPEFSGDARCRLNTQTRTVAGANLASGGPPIDKTMEFFKKNGWCEESSPDYDKLMAALLQNLAANLGKRS
jgi:hypothetical protein